MESRFNIRNLLVVLMALVCFPLICGAQYQIIQKGIDIDGIAGDESGFSVSMPDSITVAVGAIGNSDNGTEAGRVRVFQWNGSSWQQKGNSILGQSAYDRSGWSVSMPDGNTLAIGATGIDNNGNNAGHTRVFNWDGSSWILKGSNIDGDSPRDYSGLSVSMPDANTIAIGAPRNDNNGFDAGHTRVFSWDGLSWIQKGSDIDGDSSRRNHSGFSVSMPDANTVAIGAPGNDNNGPFAGHVRVYRVIGKLGFGEEMTLFPNPTTGSISVITPNVKPTSIRILDLAGREILNSPFTETIHQPEHLSGVFVIELELEGGVYREKVLKL